MIIPNHEEVKDYNDRAAVLKNGFDELLKTSKDPAGILSFAKSEEFKYIAAKNQDIYILSKNAAILDEEIRAGETVLLIRGRNADDIIKLYRMITLCLRRIEFDLDERSCAEAVDFVLANRVSLTYVLGVIRLNGILKHNEKILNGFKTLLSERL